MQTKWYYLLVKHSCFWFWWLRAFFG